MIVPVDNVLSHCVVPLQAVREENQALKRDVEAQKRDVEALRQQASEQVIQKRGTSQSTRTRHFYLSMRY